MTTYYIELYRYGPSVKIASLFAVVFTLFALVHTYQLVRTRAWYWSAFVLGVWLEVVGYVARAISASQNPEYTLVPWAIATIPVLLAPTCFAASLYMTQPRIARLIGAGDYTLIPVDWFSKIFVTGDLICFFAQAAGKHRPDAMHWDGPG